MPTFVTTLPVRPFQSELDALLAKARAQPDYPRRYERFVRTAFLALRRDLGMTVQHPYSLGGRHVDALVAHWRGNNKVDSTISFNLSALRWFAGLIGKPGLIKRNSDYGVSTAPPNSEPGIVVDAELFTAATQIDPTFAYALWLRETIRGTRDEILRTRGTDVVGNAWTGNEKKGVTPRTVRLTSTQGVTAVALVKHIIETHGKASACLGWSGHYRRVDCPLMERDLRRWKYLEKKLRVQIADAKK